MGKHSRYSKSMQFAGLVRPKPGEHVFFLNDIGSRLMRYDLNPANDEKLAKKYPLLAKLFDKNNDLLSRHLSLESRLECEYVSQGRNILSNWKGVCPSDEDREGSLYSQELPAAQEQPRYIRLGHWV